MQRPPWSRSPSTGSVLDELAVVADPLARVALRLADALDLEEAAELAHQDCPRVPVAGAPMTSVAASRSSVARIARSASASSPSARL